MGPIILNLMHFRNVQFGEYVLISWATFVHSIVCLIISFHSIHPCRWLPIVKFTEFLEFTGELTIFFVDNLFIFWYSSLQKIMQIPLRVARRIRYSSLWTPRERCSNQRRRARGLPRAAWPGWSRSAAARVRLRAAAVIGEAPSAVAFSEISFSWGRHEENRKASHADRRRFYYGDGLREGEIVRNIWSRRK